MQLAGVAAVLAGSAIALYAERRTVASGIGSVRHARLAWVAAGVACETLSMAAFAQLQRRLLAVGGATFTLPSMLASVYTSNAIAVAVPVAGTGLATAYSYRQFRSHGADPALVGLALTIGGVASTLAFAAVVAVGAVLTGNPAAAAVGSVAAVIGPLGVFGVLHAVHGPRGRHRLQRVTVAVVRPLRWLLRRPGEVDGRILATLERVDRLRLGYRTPLAAFGWALLNWLADAACLAIAIAAVGLPVPWRQLLVVWGAASGAGSVSPTPAGIGVVDVALIVGLTAAHLTGPQAVGAVLVYRVITFKVVITLIWLGWATWQQRCVARPAGTGPLLRL